jgi:hypothetical protein
LCTRGTSPTQFVLLSILAQYWCLLSKVPRVRYAEWLRFRFPRMQAGLPALRKLKCYPDQNITSHSQKKMSFRGCCTNFSCDVLILHTSANLNFNLLALLTSIFNC